LHQDLVSSIEARRPKEGNNVVLPAWTWIIGFWFGAAVGSFLNVVIYRMPRGISVYKPANSFCPGCQKQLTAAELVPLLSWLFQKGKCSCGKSKVSSRYFWVEMATGLLWAVIWYQQLVVIPPGAESAMSTSQVIYAVGYMLFSAALVAAIGTDLAHYIIPDQVNAFMLFVGVGMNIALAMIGDSRAWMWGMPSSIAGALVGFGVLWGITLLGRVAFGKDAMGHGDIKMARGIGAVLLPLGAGISFALAVFLGALFGILIVALRKKDQAPAEEPEADEEPYVPESIGSIFWCGLGYILCIDIIGLAFPKLYEKWFGENPYAVEEISEEAGVEPTMIPFGPYLAAGALCVVMYGAPLTKWVLDYFNGMSGL